MSAKNLLRVSQKGACLHVYNKGIDNKLIFVDEADYQVFISFLKEYLSNPESIESKKKSFTVKGKTYQGTPHQPKNYFGKVELVAYSLLPEHFHIVLHQCVEGALESFLRSICTRYSIYFNKRYKRQGALFDGPYKSAHITSTELLLHYVCYLHKAHAENKYSSQGEYYGKTSTNWLKASILLSLYGDAENKRQETLSSFKKFADKYKIDKSEKDLLANVIIEKEIPALESRILDKDLASQPVLTPNRVQVSSRSTKGTTRVPEYITLLLIFITFLGLGIRNIKVTAINSKDIETTKIQTLSDSNSTSIAQVPEKKDQYFDTVSSIDEIISKQNVLSATDSASQTLLDPESILYSVVSAKEGAGTVFVYKEKDRNSEVITTISDTDTLVAMPIDTEWYEVRFSDSSKGFVLAEYLRLKEINN